MARKNPVDNRECEFNNDNTEEKEASYEPI